MARKTRGTLYLRGETYWLEYWTNGVRHRQSLEVTKEEDAERERDRVLAPLSARDEEQRRRMVADALKSASEVKAAADLAARVKLPLSEVWTRYPYEVNTRGTTERRLSESSVRDFRSLWDHFASWAGDHKVVNVEDVTGEHVETFRRDLAKSNLSADRVNKIFLTCRAMFRAAKVEPNPFNGFRKLAHKSNGRRELTEPELRAVCGSAKGELRTLYAIGLYCGFRLGDACQLDWSEVARDLSRVIREPSKTRYKGNELVIPVHPVLAAILAETPAAQRVGPVLPETCAAYKVNSTTVVRKVSEHFTACGIRLHRPGTGIERDPATGKRTSTGRRAVVEVGYHSMRHSFVSLAARQGVPLHVIQALCGHSTPAVQRLYLHNTDADTRQAIDSLPSMEGPKALPAPTDATCADLRQQIAQLLPLVTEAHLRAILATLKG
jgi:integrase